ncbi:MAG: GTPase-associated system all-helical protein GASH [Candidatus Acidiferrales bacterium]
MHSKFAEWYNEISIRPTAETLEARWKAVEVVAAAMKVRKVPELVRVFFNLPGGIAVVEELRAAAKTDKTYLTEGDQKELSVLAGGVIAELLRKPSGQADAAALAVTCVEAQGLRKVTRLQGVVDECASYLANESVRMRTVDKSPVADVNVVALTKRIAERGGVAVSDANSVWSGVEVVLKDLLTQHTAHTNSINSALDETVRRLTEQNDILWWLFGEHTLDGSKSFQDLSVPEACYWGAKDLAALTRFMPGPFAAPAFLNRMLRRVKEKVPTHVRIEDAINYCRKDWREAWLPELSVPQLMPDLCPMLFGIAKAAEVGGGTGWTAAFQHGAGLAANAKLDPTQLALQIYNELLLVRALNVKEA